MFYNVYFGICILKLFSYLFIVIYNFRWDREIFCDYMNGFIYVVVENSDFFNKM